MRKIARQNVNTALCPVFQWHSIICMLILAIELVCLDNTFQFYNYLGGMIEKLNKV